MVGVAGFPKVRRRLRNVVGIVFCEDRTVDDLAVEDY